MFRATRRISQVEGRIFPLTLFMKPHMKCKKQRKKNKKKKIKTHMKCKE